MSSLKETVLVTGGSGHLGSLVIEHLLKHYEGQIITTTRNPEKLAIQGVTVRLADFDKPETLTEAFAGAQRLLLISTDSVGVPGQRIQQHKNAVEAAVQAGVKHIVYTSVPNPEPGSACLIAPDHYATEQLIKSSGLSYTILRNNLYSEFLIPSLQQAVASGILGSATGDGATAYVTRLDCALSAASALITSSTDNKILDVTGPDAITGSELAQIASDISGKSIQFVPLETAKVIEIFESIGLPNEMAQLYASFNTASAKGEYSQVSETVHLLSGQSPLSLKQFLTDNRQQFVSSES